MQSAGLWPFIQFSPRWGGLHYTLQHPDQSIQVFPITPRDWTDTWKHICYYLLQPFGNDITEIRGAGKYCRSFIIPDAPSPVISEKFPGQWDYFISLPLPLSLPSPHRYPCPNGTLWQGVCLTQVTRGSSFSPLANAKLPPSPCNPRGPGTPSPPTPLLATGADGEGKCSSLNTKILPIWKPEFGLCF